MLCKPGFPGWLHSVLRPVLHVSIFISLLPCFYLLERVWFANDHVPSRWQQSSKWGHRLHFALQRFICLLVMSKDSSLNLNVEIVFTTAGTWRPGWEGFKLYPFDAEGVQVQRRPTWCWKRNLGNLPVNCWGLGGWWATFTVVRAWVRVCRTVLLMGEGTWIPLSHLELSSLHIISFKDLVYITSNLLNNIFFHK